MDVDFAELREEERRKDSIRPDTIPWYYFNIIRYSQS